MELQMTSVQTWSRPGVEFTRGRSVRAIGANRGTKGEEVLRAIMMGKGNLENSCRVVEQLDERRWQLTIDSAVPDESGECQISLLLILDPDENERHECLYLSDMRPFNRVWSVKPVSRANKCYIIPIMRGIGPYLVKDIASQIVALWVIKGHRRRTLSGTVVKYPWT
jgi:hypothetical protein